MSIEVKSTFSPQESINGLLKDIQEVIDEELEKSVDELRQRSPIGVTGDLKEGWDYTPVSFTFYEFNATIANTASFSFNRLEGRVAGKQPPSSALESWVAAKLNVSGKELKRVAFLVARKIGREGTVRGRRSPTEITIAGDPVPGGGTIDNAIKRIENRLGRI